MNFNEFQLISPRMLQIFCSSMPKLNLAENEIGPEGAEAWCLFGEDGEDPEEPIMKGREVNQYGSRQSQSKVKW